MKALILILWTLMISFSVFGQTKMVVHKTNGEKDTLATSAVEKITFFVPETGNTVTDIDGNVYQVVQIGNQLWTVENLRTTKYNDGTDIPKVVDNIAWTGLSTGAYCAYNNDENNKDTYGYLYNWYAVDTGKLAPEGWRVPTDADWTVLTDFVGGEVVAGGKLKASSGWNFDLGTDDFGFHGLPGGARSYSDGTFYDLLSSGYWWSSTTHGTEWSWYRDMTYFDLYVDSSASERELGFSVRLVRDVP